MVSLSINEFIRTCSTYCSGYGEYGAKYYTRDICANYNVGNLIEILYRPSLDYNLPYESNEIYSYTSISDPKFTGTVPKKPLVGIPFRGLSPTRAEL